MSSVRCFVALPTPPDVLRHITSLITTLQSVPSDVKWEHSEKLHITLKFLGNLKQEQIEKLIRGLEVVGKAFSSFEYTYDGVGAFPNLSSPRIFWVGTSPNPSMTQLHKSVEEVARSINVSDENKPFHPHVTIGRAKGFKGINRLTAILKTVTFEPVNARCSALLVLRSDLHPTGSKYSVLARIPFNL